MTIASRMGCMLGSVLEWGSWSDSQRWMDSYPIITMPRRSESMPVRRPRAAELV